MYGIDWPEVGKASDGGLETMPPLPTLDHAIYLIQLVQFSCGQLFHLFDEEDFMESCHRYYADTAPDASVSLWLLHFYLVIALGKALQSRPHQGGHLPFGHDLFLAVLKNLPGPGVLFKQPLVSIEILSCAALYLQCIDHRQYANLLVCTTSFSSQDMAS